jgi:hypothetical protein
MVGLRSFSPYSQSQPHHAPKLPKELPDAYEQRTWRQRMHVDLDGHVFIPPMAFQNALIDVAQFLGEKIPGKGNRTWAQPFASGILITEPLVLPDVAAEVPGEELFVPADGRRGGGKRVWRTFPVIRSWEGVITIHVLNDLITKDVFQQHLDAAGTFIGIGRFRPQNKGFYGRFSVASLQWD